MNFWSCLVMAVLGATILMGFMAYMIQLGDAAPVNFGLWILLAIAGVIGLVVFAAYLVQSYRRRSWSQLAERANLTFEPGNFSGRGLSVKGVYQGRQLTMDTFSKRSGGRDYSTFTRIVLVLRQPTAVNLRLSTEGFLSRVGRLLGMEDIQIGDEALDRRYVIKGFPQNLVLAIFQSYDLRQRLQEAPALFLRVEGQQVYYEKRGFHHNDDNLISLFDLMTSLAGAVERLQPSRDTPKWAPARPMKI